MVSVPLQGTYLPYDFYPTPQNLIDKVSVPLQGTYLPYLVYQSRKRIELKNRFRPLTGDLSSLQVENYLEH